MIVAFRRHTLLPLDDCLYALQPSIPHLTRSSLHRCLQRHGISRLPDVEGDKPKRQKFKRYPIGFFHIDIAEVRTEEGKLFLFVGIDRTRKFAVAQLVEKANRKTAREFLELLLEAVPYKTHTILTDNLDRQRHPVRRAAQKPEHLLFQADAVRHDLRSQRYRTSPDQTEPSLDQWTGRAHEPHHQRGDGETLPLREPQAVAQSSRRLSECLQFRTQIEDTQRSHTI